MNFNLIKRYFLFTKQQQTGIFILFIIIIVLQFFYFFSDFKIVPKKSAEETKWMALQSEIDILKSQKNQEAKKVYLFNPNYITDYKGYKLGMSTQEIDRLLAFRKENKFINSAEDFQKVTKISDSLLAVISPLFKFPDWVKNEKFNKEKEKTNYILAKKEKITILNINEASQEDLIKIYGIGEGLSKRILKQKEALGCFVSMEQLNDVWGLSPEVIEELNAHFKVIATGNIKKINVNEASLKELMQFPYFNYGLAKQIITTRSMEGNFSNIEELIKIKGFPVEKAKIISLYLKL